MIRNSKTWGRVVIGIIITSFFCLSPQVSVLRAVTCAPGDVPLDENGQVVTDLTTATVTRCLYGSEMAQDRGFGTTMTDPRANIRTTLNIAMGFLGVIVVVMVLYGGLLWLTAAGREEQITKGKHVLLWSAVGAVIISIAWTITSYILQMGSTIG